MVVIYNGCRVEVGVYQLPSMHWLPENGNGCRACGCLRRVMPVGCLHRAAVLYWSPCDGLSCDGRRGDVCVCQDLTYHLLDSLATCKSCVILALLTNEGVPGGLEQLVEMFEVLLTGVRPEHDEV